MPRPKGSKNKQKTPAIDFTVDFSAEIARVEEEIAALTEQLKEKKAELKKLVKDKVEADKVAAEKKAEEEKAKLLDAVTASGKSIEEIIEMIQR